MSRRDLLVLFGIALLARIAAAWLIDYPPYTDPAYYFMVGQQLVDGHGFTAPALWSFLEVGGRLPAQPTLPVHERSITIERHPTQSARHHTPPCFSAFQRKRTQMKRAITPAG